MCLFYISGLDEKIFADCLKFLESSLEKPMFLKAFEKIYLDNSGKSVSIVQQFKSIYQCPSNIIVFVISYCTVSLRVRYTKQVLWVNQSESSHFHLNLTSG